MKLKITNAQNPSAATNAGPRACPRRLLARPAELLAHKPAGRKFSLGLRVLMFMVKA